MQSFMFMSTKYLYDGHVHYCFFLTNYYIVLKNYIHMRVCILCFKQYLKDATHNTALDDFFA